MKDWLMLKKKGLGSLTCEEVKNYGLILMGFLGNF